jgi:uncharacterized membrane protein
LESEKSRKMIATLHAILIHFPIALFIVAWIAELLRVLFNYEVSTDVSNVCLYIGLIGAVLSVMSGFFAAGFPIGWFVIKFHALFAIISFILSGIVLMIDENKYPVLRLVALTVLVVLIGITGFFGGEIVRPHIFS